MLHKMMEDQAAGLRRMLGKKDIKTFLVLSAIPSTQKNTLLLNLASSLIHAGNSTHLVDTYIDRSGVSSRLQTLIKSDLWGLALKNQSMDQGFYEFMPGGRISQLAGLPTAQLISQSVQLEQLSNTIQSLSNDSNIWFLDAQLKLDNPLLIPEFSDSEIILIISSTPASIKNGYSQLKHISQTLGRRHVSVVINHTDLTQAQHIYKNISTAARDYLSIPVSFLGHIPSDEDLTKSALLGKSIIEAFPLSKAAHALRSISKLLIDKNTGMQFIPPSSQSQPLVLEH